MIAIITGDIIESEENPPKDWLDALKQCLKLYGKTPNDWEMYRGDEFQLKVKKPKNAMRTALSIKAKMKSETVIDLRMAIGIGKEEYKSEKLSESNGEVYVFSGRKLDELKKEKNSMQLKSNFSWEKEMNLLLKFAMTIADKWTQASAEVMFECLKYPEKTQTELAEKLGIQQNTFSERRKRANVDLFEELIHLYEEKIQHK